MELQPSLSMTLEPGGFDAYWLLAFVIMLVAGALGGLLNRHLAERYFGAETPDKTENLKRHLIFGVAIALIVPPLLLAILSSGLLDAARLNPSGWYVFAAFCLMCVIVSYRVFENFTTNSACRRKMETLEAEICQIRQTQEALYHYLEPIVEAASEKEVPRGALTYGDMELLRALSDESYIYGNLTALTEKTGLGRELVSQRLTALRNLGLIDTRVNDGNVLRWIISARGRQTLAKGCEDPN